MDIITDASELSQPIKRSAFATFEVGGCGFFVECVGNNGNIVHLRKKTIFD